MRTRVQIYTAQTPGEASALATLGVDHVGVTPSDHGLPGEVDLATARSIRDALVGEARSVALSVDSDAASIAAMVEAVQPDILHLCGPPGAFSPEAVAALRDVVSGVEIMQAIAMDGSSALRTAHAFAPVVDYLILDSVAPDIPGIGAAGTIHDWTISAAIVRQVDIPVVLAGGLSPENVAEAITTVRPWGVDSLTHTNRAFDTGEFRKDMTLVEAFVTAVQEVDRS